MSEKRENPFYGVETVASFTECTGLMPVLPDNDGQNTNYAALYATHTALKRPRKRNEERAKLQ